jgi:hypothetical protein
MNSFVRLVDRAAVSGAYTAASLRWKRVAQTRRGDMPPADPLTAAMMPDRRSDRTFYQNR